MLFWHARGANRGSPSKVKQKLPSSANIFPLSCMVAQRRVYVDWQAFDQLNVNVPTWMRVGATMHSERCVESFTPANVSVKFWSAPVKVWTGAAKRRQVKGKRPDEDGLYELDSDVGGDPAAEHGDGGADLFGDKLDDVGAPEAIEAELEELFGDIDYVDGFAGDDGAIDEVVQQLEQTNITLI